jgi:hypothetical protein
MDTLSNDELIEILKALKKSNDLTVKSVMILEAKIQIFEKILKDNAPELALPYELAVFEQLKVLKIEPPVPR